MKKILALTICSLVSLFSYAQISFIESESEWFYFDNNTAPPDQGALDWTDVNYVPDAAWEVGDAELGHGENDQNTDVNSSVNAFYVRQNFVVNDPAAFTEIVVSLEYDDGAVVYLNGTEIRRQNMPSGTIVYETDASSSEEDIISFDDTNPNLLVQGTNVVAVEIHQKQMTNNSTGDLSFDLSMDGITQENFNVIRGPYLQMPSSKSMTIRWRTENPTESYVNIGTDLNNLNTTEFDNTLRTDHEVVITQIDVNGTLEDLSPDTEYFYSIGNAAGVIIPASADYYFRTTPTMGTATPLRAWILGDCGEANNNQRDVRNAYYDETGDGHTDMILFLGDNAYDSDDDPGNPGEDYLEGSDEAFQYSIFENMYENVLRTSPAWSCIGNHDVDDDFDDDSDPYFDIFTFPTDAAEDNPTLQGPMTTGTSSGTEKYYSFDFGNAHFICLNSEQESSSHSHYTDMINWCNNDIMQTNADWIIAFWHHPPFSDGSHNADLSGSMSNMRELFLQTLEDNGVDLVLGGHSHAYERSYFMHGFYGDQDDFNFTDFFVGNNGDKIGQIEHSEGAYCKTPNSQAGTGEGTVYIVTGSAAKASINGNNAGTLDHPAMVVSELELGSCILEIDGNELNVQFLPVDGIGSDDEDHFTIIKEDCGTPPNNNCERVIFDDFDDDQDNYGNWNDGGLYCGIGGHSNSGDHSLKLSHSQPSSQSVTDVLDMSGTVALGVEFNFVSVGMTQGDRFHLEVNPDALSQFSNYVNLGTWQYGVDFDNENENGRVFVDLCIPTSELGQEFTYTSSTIFRMRCESLNGDHRVYIDDIEILKCPDCEGGTEPDCIKVAASLDDAQEKLPGQSNPGTVNATGSSLGLGAGYHVGLRFVTEIPANATITNAHIQFSSVADRTGTLQIITGVDPDVLSQNDPMGPFEHCSSTACTDISERQEFTNPPVSVLWDTGAWGDGDTGPAQATDDLTAIVQRMVNSANYNGTMVFRFVESTGGRADAASADNSNGKAPQLCVEFDRGGGEGKGGERNNTLTNALINLTVTPNPFQDQFLVQFDSQLPQNGQAYIYRADGTTQMATTVQAGQTQMAIDAKDWPAGMYFLIINNGDQQLVEKLMKH